MLTSTARRADARTQAPDLRGAILKAARELLFRYGTDGISARKIARRAGCSATAIYIYYRNLNDLLHHLRMEGHTILARYLTANKNAAGALAYIESMGRNYYRFGIDNRQYYDLMFLARASRAA